MFVMSKIGTPKGMIQIDWSMILMKRNCSEKAATNWKMNGKRRHKYSQTCDRRFLKYGDCTVNVRIIRNFIKYL